MMISLTALLDDTRLIPAEKLARHHTKKELVEMAERCMKQADYERANAEKGYGNWQSVHRLEDEAERLLEASYLVIRTPRMPRGYNQDGHPFY